MSVTAGETRARKRTIPQMVAIVAGLAVLLSANYYLRSTLEDAPRYLYSFLERFYADQLPIIFGELPAWRLFLPLKEITGAWVTSTLILTYLLERSLTPAGVWYLYNALAILVAFGTSWVLFRSAVFSFTFAIAIGFGTQFYHAYAVTGGIASYIVAVYHMLLLFTAVQIVRGAKPRWLWCVAFGLSLALNIFGYEGWLDVLVLVLVSVPFVYVALRRLDRAAEATRFARVAQVFVAAGVMYIVIKVTVGFGQVQGSESDVVFNYTSFWLVADDLIANAFTHTYLSVSNFLPPAFVGASAFYRLGADELVRSQHQYHEPFTYLVPMHQVFFWRFYAGAALTLVLAGIYRASAAMWRRPSAWTLALIVFLLMVLVPGSTHTVIKFRPMNAMPVMTYHVTLGVIGASLLLAWAVATAWRTWSNRRAAVAVVLLAWGTVFYSALARPPYLAHMAAQSGLGEFLYPNPMRMLIEKMGGTYSAPSGLALYRLAPYAQDQAFAGARNALSELPLRLPPPAEWAPGLPEWVKPVDGATIEVNGDDTQFGYQIMSPVVPVSPATRYLLRLRFDVAEGRVCAGVLSADQQRWVVAPDGTTPEYAFDSGDLDGVRVVVANCYGYDRGNPKSRFRLRGGSYGIVSATKGAAP